MPRFIARLACTGLAFAACTVPAHAGRAGMDASSAGIATEAPTQLEGTLTRYFINPLGRIDLLQLDDGTLVCLPPALGEGAAQFVRPGERVRAIVARGHGRGEPHARALINVDSGRSLLDTPDLRAEGKIVRVLGSPRRPRGLLLEDGTVVRLSPRLAHRNRSLLQPGATIRADGVGTRNEFGVAVEAFSLDRLPD
ncbi:MAG: hypothetical protein ABS91_03500 [Thiobacillus sp. SCN 64-35]|nr:MAG: hypothetical protein ABS91_03500 [Thiobacillus sp. SCN 64-35]